MPKITVDDFKDYSKRRFPIRLVIPAAIVAAAATGTLLLLFSPIAVPFVLAIACGVFVGFNILGLALNSVANLLHRFGKEQQYNHYLHGSYRQILEKSAAERAIGPMMVFALALSAVVVTPLILFTPLAPWLLALIAVFAFGGFLAIESLYSLISNRDPDPFDYRSPLRSAFGEVIYLRSAIPLALILGVSSSLLLAFYAGLAIGVVIGIGAAVTTGVIAIGLGMSALAKHLDSYRNYNSILDLVFALLVAATLTGIVGGFGIISGGLLAGVFFGSLVGALLFEFDLAAGVFKYNSMYLRSALPLALILGAVIGVLLAAYAGIAIGVAIVVGAAVTTGVMAIGVFLSSLELDEEKMVLDVLFALAVAATLTGIFGGFGIISGGLLAGLFFASLAGTLLFEGGLAIAFVKPTYIYPCLFLGVTLAAVAFGFGLLPLGLSVIAGASVSLLSPLVFSIITMIVSNIIEGVSQVEPKGFPSEVLGSIVAGIGCSLTAGLFLGLLHFAVIPTVVVALTALVTPMVLTLAFELPKMASKVAYQADWETPVVELGDQTTGASDSRLKGVNQPLLAHAEADGSVTTALLAAQKTQKDRDADSDPYNRLHSDYSSMSGPMYD